MTDTSAPLDARRRFLKTTGLLSLAGMAPSLGRQAFAKTAPGPGTAQDIIMADALTLSGWIAQRQVSCHEVMVAYLDHIDRVNPKVNAIVSLQERSGLLAQADKRDQQLKAGQYMGWMHGMPQAPKDLAATVDIVTTSGSPIFKDYLPKQDAIVVERVRQSGAILIGKTNTPEFGLGSHTYNAVFGTTGNAYQPDLCAGGSSGGAAVALATRMLPVADGSDMMGSLRNPGAFNNVYGFRPSQGRVPYGPTSEVFFQQMGYEGPMGRTVSDLAMLLSTQAGFDARSPLSISQDPQQFAGRLQRDFKGTRIGWLGDYNGYLPMEAGIMDLCQSALKSFEAIGCTVEAAQPDYSMEQLWQTWLTLRHFTVAGSAQGLYAKPELREKMKPEAIWEVAGGLNLSGAQVYQASINRSKWYEALRKLFQTYDYLVLPTAQVFPFAGTTHWPGEIAGRKMDTYHRWMEIVIGGSLAGLPVMNVPAGFNAAGLPMGLQIMGPVQADMVVLQLSYAYEQATQWVQKRTPALLG